jgi:hypothetical protein
MTGKMIELNGIEVDGEERNVRLTEHAIERHQERVQNITEDHWKYNSDDMVEASAEDMKSALTDPEVIHQTAPSKSQVHIKGETALIVGVKEGVVVYPYRDFDEELTVHTVYDSSVFKEKYGVEA